MSTSAKTMRTVLKALAESADTIAASGDVTVDPRIVNAETKLRKAVGLLEEAWSLNEVAAMDKRREAARIARSTGTILMGVLAA